MATHSSFFSFCPSLRVTFLIYCIPFLKKLLVRRLTILPILSFFLLKVAGDLLVGALVVTLGLRVLLWRMTLISLGDLRLCWERLI